MHTRSSEIQNNVNNFDSSPTSKKREACDFGETTSINLGAKMTTFIEDDAAANAVIKDETPSVVQPAPAILDDDAVLKIDEDDLQNRSMKSEEKNVAISPAIVDKEKYSYRIVARFLNRKKFELQILNDGEDGGGDGRRTTGNWILTHEKAAVFMAQKKIELERVKRNLAKIAELRTEIQKLYCRLQVEEMQLKSFRDEPAVEKSSCDNEENPDIHVCL